MNFGRSNYHSRPRKKDDLGDGILLIDKPSGCTSHDVVDQIRKQFNLAKVGHGGTLDPMATGLLVILLGRGTKLSDRIMGGDKSYEGVMYLGKTTDTQDVEGNVLTEASCEGITEEMVAAAIGKWVGDVWQTPPMISAIKKNGVPLYKLARQGQTVERQPRLLHVYEFVIKKYELPRVWFALRSTKGTYVRTLCADIGEGLGCGAYLEELRRTASGFLRVEQAHKLDDILNMSPADLRQLVIPSETVITGG